MFFLCAWWTCNHQIVHGAAWYQQRAHPPPTKSWPEPTSTLRWKSSSATPSSLSQSASSLTLHLSRWQQGPMTTLTAWPPVRHPSQASAALLLRRPNLRMSAGSWTWPRPRHTDLVRRWKLTHNSQPFFSSIGIEQLLHPFSFPITYNQLNSFYVFFFNVVPNYNKSHLKVPFTLIQSKP